jgi:hypothetical protein
MTMHPDLQRFLDGELLRESLSPDLQRQADEFELATRLVARANPGAPAWLENRIMVALPAAAPVSVWQRMTSWLVEPKPIRLRPATAMFAMAAAVAAISILPNEDAQLPAPAVGTSNATLVTASSPIFVQFVLRDANAKSVAVSGDFNDWQQNGVALRDSDGDGVWTGLIALRPGLHKYMFVVDGQTWMTDPEADRYVDDGFGMRNAVITVAPPAPRAS